MRFPKIIVFILTSALCIMSANLMAGGVKGQKGIGFSATDVTPTFKSVIWVSDNVKFEPSIAFASFSPDEGDGLTRFIPGLGILYSFRVGEPIRPFVGIRGAFDMLSADGESYSDIMFAPAVGAEYFFSDHFSVAGEYQMQIIMADDQLSPNFYSAGSTMIESAEMLSVHFYF